MSASFIDPTKKPTPEYLIELLSNLDQRVSSLETRITALETRVSENAIQLKDLNVTDQASGWKEWKEQKQEGL